MHIDLAGGRLREMRGATLALVVERPGHGYELASRLNHRLGPTWKVEPRQVYAILNGLAKDGLVTRRWEPNRNRERQPRAVYYSTKDAPEALRRWMGSELETVPLRPGVIARLTAGAPGDAEKLLSVLDDYEGQLLRLLEANDDADPPVRTWRGLLLAITRNHTDSYLQGEFQWIATTRRRIREFVAAQ